jgi:hypothetical protein
MSGDLFSDLADEEVPPLPTDLMPELHERLNYVLLYSHLLDFALGALPFAVTHFSKALGGLIFHCLLGEFPADSQRPSSPESEDNPEV